MIEALWMLSHTLYARRSTSCSGIVLLDDRRIVGGNDRRHFLGTYRIECGRLFFRLFVSFHGEAAPSDDERIADEMEGIGEISPDKRQIDYVAHVVGCRDVRCQGTLRRIAEVPNFRKLA